MCRGGASQTEARRAEGPSEQRAPERSAAALLRRPKKMSLTAIVRDILSFKLHGSALPQPPPKAGDH